MKVFVTGIGAISPIGLNIKENLSHLRSGTTGISPSKYFNSKYSKTHLFGEVKISNNELIELLNLTSSNGLTRTCLLAFKAFEEAVLDSGLLEQEISNFETAFISASTVGGMCLTDQLYLDANLQSKTSDYAKSYGFSAHSFQIIKKYKIKGWTDTINTACSSSANAIMLAYRLIKSGRAKRVIVGGVDSIAKYTVNGFSALDIFSTEICKPFDKDRKGLNIGEGAAYLVLESEEISQNKVKYAQISGYGNANDAYHASSISENATGVVNSISQAIESANIKESDIDYINAHGTATGNNDFVELKAFTKIFKDVPLFNSTKSYTGHMLGASGAIEAVYTALSIKNQELYPSLNFTNPIEEYNLKPILEFKSNCKIKHALSNSYGFSGSCTSLILSKAE